MKERKLKTIQEFENILNLHQLTHIVIESGYENIYQPSTNTFIVTDDFLSNEPELFAYKDFLTYIDFSKFSFTNVKTMQDWFRGCSRLKTIIFPRNMQCLKLKDLSYCFAGTLLTELDLSYWNFDKNEVNIAGLIYSCKKVSKLVLPQATFLSISNLANHASSLTFVKFNSSKFKVSQRYNWNVRNFAQQCFFNCFNLEIVDCSQMKNTNKRLLSIFKEEINFPPTTEAIVLLPQ